MDLFWLKEVNLCSYKRAGLPDVHPHGLDPSLDTRGPINKWAFIRRNKRRSPFNANLLIVFPCCTFSLNMQRFFLENFCTSTCCLMGLIYSYNPASTSQSRPTQLVILLGNQAWCWNIIKLFRKPSSYTSQANIQSHDPCHHEDWKSKPSM